MTFVVAVSNLTAPTQPSANVAQGDYELVVTITAVDSDSIALSAFIDALDAAGTRRQVTISRRQRHSDLARASQQIFGFGTGDPPVVDDSTSLGPSRTVVDALRTTGRSPYAFRNFAGQPKVSGTLVRDEKAPTQFPVLVNGQRVVLPAIRAIGQMTAGTAVRPFEQIVLDDPRHPISLRIAYGPRDGGFPFKPDFVREVVRIDYPQLTSLAESLQRDCHVAVSGIYFDFDQATLKPPSRRALEEIAAALRTRPTQAVRIEGHTDNVGSESYNDDLSARRAAAVRTALGRDLGLDVVRISSAGIGARRPVESNDTLAGRARNRRVELVRECPGR